MSAMRQKKHGFTHKFSVYLSHLRLLGKVILIHEARFNPDHPVNSCSSSHILVWNTDFKVKTEAAAYAPFGASSAEEG
jgi:hypothetical protein